MLYGDHEYKLAQTASDEYVSNARDVAIGNKMQGMVKTLETMLMGEDPNLPFMITESALNLHRAYGGGGGMYAVVVCSGIRSLRKNNPDLPPIDEQVWTSAMTRERDLRNRPAIHTLETLGGIGLIEIRSVNSGYTDGFESCFRRPAFDDVTGVVGLAALHAHDLMHFASQVDL